MLDSESRWRLVRRLRTRPMPVVGEEVIRPAANSDLPKIREIYNFFVKNTVVTFDEEPMSLQEWEEKFEHLQKLGLPFLVLQGEHGEVIGFAYLAPWRQKSGYRKTAENSIYLQPAATGHRRGTELLAALIEAGRQSGVREIVAVIADRGAEASIRLHERQGFIIQGKLGKVGYKFGKPIGTILMQRSL